MTRSQIKIFLPVYIFNVYCVEILSKIISQIVHSFDYFEFSMKKFGLGLKFLNFWTSEDLRGPRGPSRTFEDLRGDPKIQTKKNFGPEFFSLENFFVFCK